MDMFTINLSSLWDAFSSAIPSLLKHFLLLAYMTLSLSILINLLYLHCCFFLSFWPLNIDITQHPKLGSLVFLDLLPRSTYPFSHLLILWLVFFLMIPISISLALSLRHSKHIPTAYLTVLLRYLLEISNLIHRSIPHIFQSSFSVFPTKVQRLSYIQQHKIKSWELQSR